MTDVQTLIDRLKAAQAPSGLLDEEIASVIGWDPDVAIPRWTASIEAAIAIVPGEPGYSIIRKGDVSAAIMGEEGVACLAATPALAMCMAALRHFEKAGALAAPRPASDQG